MQKVTHGTALAKERTMLLKPSIRTPDFKYSQYINVRLRFCSDVVIVFVAYHIHPKYVRVYLLIRTGCVFVFLFLLLDWNECIRLVLWSSLRSVHAAMWLGEFTHTHGARVRLCPGCRLMLFRNQNCDCGYPRVKQIINGLIA